MTPEEKYVFCILYRQLVRGGGVPGDELDAAFMQYQAEMIATEVVDE